MAPPEYNGIYKQGMTIHGKSLISLLYHRC
jgi:hypothetical protein